jgi:predicted amidohydrolase YtcJ
MPTERLAADILITNGVIRTLDAAGTVASAVAIRGERIIGLGTADELRPLVDKRTEIVDAGGRTVLPGFIDAHTHFQNGAVSRYLTIDWQGHRNPQSITQALEDVRQRAAVLPPGAWIRGDGISHTRVVERRLPTRWELDAVAPHHPVALIGGGHHAVAANSLALQLAGITRDTPDPPGGHIERTEDGEPTGALRETAKLRLNPEVLDSVLPTYSPEQRREPLKATMREVLAEGITSVHDMAVDSNEIAAWIRLQRAGELALRVQVLARGIEAKTPLEHIVALGLEQGLGDEWLRFGGVKMSIDGICAHRAAAVYDGYPGEPDNCGLLRIPEEDLDEAIATCHRHNIRVVVDAVGQRAVDMAMDAIDKASDGTPRPDLRHRLEHVHLPARPGQLERLASLGVIVCAQPSFVWKRGDAWLDIWGPEDLRGVMPLRRMLDLGIHVCGGTDYPGTPINPFLGLRSALSRQTRNGEVLDPRRAITLDEALRFQTTGAAYGGFGEHEKGSLEIGKLADVIILSQDPYAVPPEQLDQIRVDLTMVGGEVVYTRADAS